MVFKGTFEHENQVDSDYDETEETISLCDLPLYGDENSGEDISRDSQGSSSISSSEQDNNLEVSNEFEFSSDNLNPATTISTAAFPPENIVFCGKLISYRQPTSIREASSHVQTKKQASKKKGWSIRTWKIFSPFHGKSKSLRRDFAGAKSASMKSKEEKQMYDIDKGQKGSNIPAHNMSILASTSSGKARWHLLLFGISRFSTKMELRDMKNRQSRRHQSPPPSPMHDYEKVSVGWTKGLWGLIKALSCSHYHPHSAIVPSITSIP